MGKEGSINGEDLLDLHKRTREATHTLQANATEILEQAKRLELLTKDTPAWYSGTRAMRASPCYWHSGGSEPAISVSHS